MSDHTDPSGGSISMTGIEPLYFIKSNHCFFPSHIIYLYYQYNTLLGYSDTFFGISGIKCPPSLHSVKST